MKLHLGCCPRHISGCVHADVVDYPQVDHASSIDNLWFLQGRPVELINKRHILEHFKRDVGRVLREWYRVPRPGGRLRISVPDFAARREVHTRTHDLGLMIGPISGRRDYLYNIHYSLFDFETLKDQHEQAGLCEVRRYEWRETEHAGVDDYPQAYISHMDQERGTLNSLNVECLRPPT